METISITVIIAALTTICILGLWYLADTYWKDGNEYRRRLEKLEGESSNGRHSYPTNDGLEDAMAILIDLLMKEEMNADFREARLEAARKILGKVREGPTAYKEESNTKT